MKKWTLALVLLMCLALVMPVSAEQTAYVPGEISNQLVSEAFASGQMVGGSMMISLDLDEEKLASSEEEKAEIQMVEEVFSNAVLSGAVGLLHDSLRLELGASYGPEDNYAYADAAAEITLDGLTVESSLLPGEKVTAKWETILALCGVEQSDIEMIMSLKTMDFEAVFTELMAQIEPVAQLIAQAAAPYAQTIAEFAATIPVEVEENLPADDVYPAAAQRITISMTAQDAGRLLTTLADQLQQDATLSPMVDTLLQQLAEQNPQGALRSTAELCAQLRALAGMMTDTTPIVLVLALDESGMPTYVELFDATTDDSGFYAGLMVYPGEDPNTTIVSLSFYTSAAGGEPIASFSAAVVATVDPADANIMDAAFYMDVAQGSMTLMSMEMSMVSAPAETEDGMPGYTQDVVMNMNIDAYGETGSSQMVGSTLQQMTADGGEYITSVSEMNMDVEGEKTQQITAQEMMIAPVEGGFAGSMTSMAQMPADGVTMAMISEFGSWTHEPAALTETALENATNDEFDALIGRLTDGASAELNKLMSLLPPEVVEAFLE